MADVPHETRQRLEVFADLLRTWNRTINLVSPRDLPDLWQRHIGDSLNLLPCLPDCFSRAIDLGSGGGFPGLVLAIATDRPFALVESDQRKAAFLREAIRQTGARATVHAERAERTTVLPAPLVTARAVAPLTVLLDWATPLLAAGGCCVFPKGRTADAELTAALRQWHMRVEQWPSATDPVARILRLSEIRRV